jgi:methionyl-tRNA formyltransferase
MRIVFAGDREISVWVLEYLLEQGVRPLALLVPDSDRASHADKLAGMCPFLDREKIIRGSGFRVPAAVSLLRDLEPDYIVCVHFPYIVPEAVLAIPRGGVLNLHPAFLPYNRGWHTPSWAIWEQTPIGATLHFMDTGVDTGDIVHQAELPVSPGDTAHTLYEKLLKLEMEVFAEAWPRLGSGIVERKAQQPAKGSFHARQDLFQDAVQRIDLDEETKAGDLIRKLRALTTNRRAEAAYFEEGGKRFRIQVTINEED